MSMLDRTGTTPVLGTLTVSRGWLWLAVLLLDLTIIALAVIALLHTRDEKREQAFIAAENVSNSQEQGVASIFDKIDMGLLSVGDEVEREVAEGGIKNSELNRFLARAVLRMPEVLGLRVSNAEGMVVNAVNDAEGSDQGIGDRDYYRIARDNPRSGIIISGPILGRLSGKWIIIAARRLSGPANAFAGVVFAPILVSNIERLLAAVDMGPHGVVTLFSSDLRFVARHPESVLSGTTIGSTFLAPEASAIIAADRTSARYEAISRMDGIKRTFFIHKVSLYPLFVSVGLADQDFLSSWRDEARQVSWLVALFVIASTVTAALLNRHWRDRAAAVKFLSEQEEKFHTIADYSFCWEDWVSADGRLVWVNPAVSAMTGYSVAECLAMEQYPKPMIFPDDWPKVEYLFAEAAAGRAGDGLEVRLIRKDGSEGWCAASWQPVRDRWGRAAGHRATVRDISLQKAADQKLRLAAAVFTASQEAIVVTDSEHRIVSVNPACCRMSGYSPEELIGRAPRILWSERYDEAFFGELSRQVAEQGFWHGEVWNRRNTGEIVPYWLTISVVRDEACKITNRVSFAIFRSIRRTWRSSVRSSGWPVVSISMWLLKALKRRNSFPSYAS